MEPEEEPEAAVAIGLFVAVAAIRLSLVSSLGNTKAILNSNVFR